jgi:ActR/RegA family two-component response regulator
MISVLIVDDDTRLGKALTRALNAHGFQSESVGGYQEALTALGRRHFDVLITDLRMGDKDGIDLIQASRETASATRSILMSGYATAKESQRALDLGAIRVLCKPFETRDVIEAIERAVDSSTGYVGVVHGLSLIDMLQMFHQGRRSLTLEVLGKTHSTICMKGGEIVDARRGADSGEAALKAILEESAGSVKTRSLQHFIPSIDREFQVLLLDLLLELDEQAEASSPRPAQASSVRKIDWEGRSLEPPRAELEAACRSVVGAVDGAVGCDVVDLETGRVLGSFRSSDLAEDDVRISAAPVVELFTLARPKPCSKGKSEAFRAEAHFEELQLTSKDNIVFAKALANRRTIVLVAARRNCTVALGWARLRTAISAVEAHFAAATTALAPPEASNDGAATLAASAARADGWR